MVTLVKGNSNDFNLVFLDLLEQFPLEELKTKESFLEIIENPFVEFLLIKNDDELCGYMILHRDKSNSFLWLDYFAIFSKFHSGGFGRKSLEALRECYKDFNGMLLEVEKPNVEKTQTLRRIAFYEGLGAKLLDVEYFFPHFKGYLAMDLYFLGFGEKSTIASNNVEELIADLHTIFHYDIAHLPQVAEKIKIGDF